MRNKPIDLSTLDNVKITVCEPGAVTLASSKGYMMWSDFRKRAGCDPRTRAMLRPAGAVSGQRACVVWACDDVLVPAARR